MHFRCLWNGMFDRHRAEITVMLFTGHSLPWILTLSHIVSQARPHQWNMHFRCLWNGMFDRHREEITVMLFIGHSLPWILTLSHIVSQARPHQWNMQLPRLWNGMFVLAIFYADKSPSSFFFDTYSLSVSFLGCKALCIGISFLILSSIRWILPLFISRMVLNTRPRDKFASYKGDSETSSLVSCSFLVLLRSFIIILSCHRRVYPWPSLATSPYRSSRLVGLQGHIPYPHISAECMFELVVLLLPGHMWGSLGVPHFWARPCLSSSDLHFWFV